MRQVNVSGLFASNSHLTTISSTSLGTTDKYESVTINGNMAICCGGVVSPTLDFFDVTNPASPVHYGSIVSGGAYDCYSIGNRVVWGGSGSTFVYMAQIYPTPQVLGFLNLTSIAGAPYSVIYDGRYMYASTQNKGLTVIDALNPAAMSQVYQQGGTTNKSFGICFGQKDRLYTGVYDTAGTHVRKYINTWDISTPSSPILLNTYTFSANVKPSGISYWNNTLFVVDNQNNTVIIVDVTMPTSPNQLSIMTPSATLQPAPQAGINTTVPNKVYFYIGSGANPSRGAAIDCFDITNLNSPSLIQTVWNNIANSVGGPCTFANSLVYVANYGVAPGISSLDIHQGTTTYTASIPAINLIDASTLLTMSDASTLSDVRLQASNDVTTYINFADIPSTIMTTTNTNGLVLIPKTSLSYEAIRIAYSTLGVGSLTGVMKCLGD